MNIKHTAAAMGAALILAGVPALASAADTVAVAAPSPIRLSSVQIAPYYGQFNEFFPGLVTVSFTNESSQPVTDVVFDLTSDGNLIHQYDDAGTVAPDASVKHSFSDTEYFNDKSLTVESVTFADGTVWNNTEAMPARRQSASNGNAKSVTAETLFPYELN